MSFSQYQRMPILKPLARNCIFVVSGIHLCQMLTETIFLKIVTRIYIYKYTVKDLHVILIHHTPFQREEKIV